MQRRNWPLVIAGVVVATAVAKKAKKRVRRSADAYVKDVSAGARPIEGVGTAIAVFVGLAPGSPDLP